MTVASQSRPISAPNRRATASTFILCGALAGLAAFVTHAAEARPNGGGLRGGGAGISRSGGFGGGARAGGIQRPSGATQRPTKGQGAAQGQWGQGNRSTTASGAAGNRSGNTGVAGIGNSGATGNGNIRTAANGDTGVAGSGNGNGNVGSGNVNTGTVGSGNGNTANVNNGNVVAGNDVDIDVDNGWGGYGSGAAYATGVAVGATTTAAVVGSYYATLPAGCAPYYYGAYRYYSCGSIWYQQTVQSGSTVYVVVSDPTKK